MHAPLPVNHAIALPCVSSQGNAHSPPFGGLTHTVVLLLFAPPPFPPAPAAGCEGVTKMLTCIWPGVTTGFASARATQP